MWPHPAEMAEEARRTGAAPFWTVASMTQRVAAASFLATTVTLMLGHSTAEMCASARLKSPEGDSLKGFGRSQPGGVK